MREMNTVCRKNLKARAMADREVPGGCVALPCRRVSVNGAARGGWHGDGGAAATAGERGERCDRQGRIFQ